MDGVLVIDKPAGPTSADVVRRVRALLKVKKVGHTGTLDPLATGVLPLCLGEATKVAGFIIDGDKSYDAVIRLGQETDTLDAAGKVVSEAAVPALDASVLEAALAGFRGPQRQVPPMYSAIKQGGKRLYELARAGEEVEREARDVTVLELILRDWSASELTVSVTCTKGFFVRVLAQDLGRALGCGAHLKALRRTLSGQFTLAQALTLDRLMAPGGPDLDEVRRQLVPTADALNALPAVQLSAAEAARVAHGVPIEVSEPASGSTGASPVRVVGPDGALLAIADLERGRLKYRRVLL